MKRLDEKSLRRKVTIYIAITMLVLTILTIVSTAFIQNHRAKMQENDYNKQIHLGIEHVIKHHIRDYTFRVRRMIETENMVDLIKIGDREALYKLFKPKWELMVEEEKNLKIMHFHLADGTSFLRMHIPEKFGDKISDVRVMLQEIHSSHKKIHGYETGKHGTVYRIISPIFDRSGEYLGALEIGFNPKFILNAVHEINGFFGMIFIKEDSLGLFSEPNNIVIDGYRLQSELTPVLKEISRELEAPNKLENNMRIKLHNNNSYKTHLFTLNNYQNEPKVKIIFFQDTTDFGIFRNYLVIGLVISIGIILLVLIWLVHRRIRLYNYEVNSVYEEQIEQLNESEHRFELLYEKAPVAYQSLDEDGNIRMVNLKWTEDLGYSKEEVLGKNFGDFLVPDFKERFKENFSKFKAAGSVCEIEYGMVKKDGKIISVSVNGKIVKDDKGDFLQTHCIFTNITQQKVLREELLFNKNYLQSIFDVVPSIMITTDGRELDKVNPEMLKFFDYESVEEFKKEYDCICDFFIRENSCIQSKIGDEHWLEYILARPSELHKVCMVKDSRRHHFIVKAHYLEIDDKRRSVVIFTDVTEVEEIGEQLQYAVSGTNDGLWDWNIESNEIYFSPRWKEMLGYKDDELPNKFSTWQDRVHPDDLQETLKKIDICHHNPDIEYNNVHRLQHKDGSWVWILDRGQTLFDESGKAVRMVGFHTDITEQKELEIQLIEKEEVYADFFENTKSANVIFTSDDNGETFRIKALNTSVEELEGVKREEVIGKRVDEVFEGVEGFGILDIFKEVYKNGEPQKMPITFYEDSKLLGWRENYVFKLSNGDIVASYEDRTQEKTLEAELKASQHQFEQFMEYIPANIFIKDENNRIIYANKRASAFFKQESIIGKTSRDLLPPHIIETAEKIDELILKNGTHEELVELLGNNGEKVVCRNLGFKIYDEDKVKIGIVSIDITEEYNLKEYLHEQEELMIAQSRHAAMGEMISMIAHQWRQPISVIAMDANNILADIELDMVEERSLKGSSEDIIKQTQELSKTIDDFRNFFKPEKDVQEVVVKELFNDTLGVIGKALENSQVEFSLELDENKKVTTYTRELMQVFINIIKNAQEVLIEKNIENKKISIYTSEDEENFKLKICDNAGGVDAENMEKIFNPYFTTKGDKNGTGLGLYMSRTIVEKHLQGSLTVDNDDEGACFEITIPHVIK